MTTGISTELGLPLNTLFINLTMTRSTADVQYYMEIHIKYKSPSHLQEHIEHFQREPKT